MAIKSSNYGKYSKRAKKEFLDAVKKHEAFKEQMIKFALNKEEGMADKVIDNFVEGLGFNIYCEDYIICLIHKVLEMAKEDAKNQSDYIELLTMITADYAKEHSDKITNEFKDLLNDMLSLYQLNVLICFMEYENGKNK